MTIDITKLLSISTVGKNRWELDNIVYGDRSTNPHTLLALLKRIQELQNSEHLLAAESAELETLLDISSTLDQDQCEKLLNESVEDAQNRFIEDLARRGALETLCNNKLNVETMNLMCKLNPEEFILTAKRSQELINTIRELVIQGETLSDDVGGA